MRALLEDIQPAAPGGRRRRSRRTWSEAEKQRIVAEAAAPGASVAEIAQRHGVNANLVFTWRRMAQARAQAAPGAPAGPPQPVAVASTVATPDFIPLGIYGPRADRDAPPAGGLAPAVSVAPPPSRVPPPRGEGEDRPGTIEIDLADGTRLRVDAFVNERALRRVLTVLKGRS